ncbi:hypothetical protein LCGC14_1611580 [marine sediment metagenome]|uniref:Uncharacterized protein n=1 Tax=marine sediment metagenome TaxID=412755 RepID=A0A0F9L8B9_9ZZZZ
MTDGGCNKDDEELDAVLIKAIEEDDVDVAVLFVHDFGCIECHNSDQKDRCPIRKRIVDALERV